VSDSERRKYHRDAKLQYVELRLDAWAEWVRRDRLNLGLPTSSAIDTAMRLTKVGIEHGYAGEPEEDDDGIIQGRRTALGRQTRVSRSHEPVHIPDDIAETDKVVARLADPLKDVVHANYFTPGPTEARAQASGYQVARFKQLLESAKWSIWTALDHSQAVVEI